MPQGVKKMKESMFFIVKKNRKKKLKIF